MRPLLEGVGEGVERARPLQASLEGVMMHSLARGHRRRNPVTPSAKVSLPAIVVVSAYDYPLKPLKTLDVLSEAAWKALARRRRPLHGKELLRELGKENQSSQPDSACRPGPTVLRGPTTPPTFSLDKDCLPRA